MTAVPSTLPSFAELGLPEPLVSALGRGGIGDPFPVQAACIPDILAGRDVLGRAQTGSGKTLAFGLPLIARLAGEPAASRRPRAFVLVPTRELAMQVRDALAPLARALGLRTGTVVGGQSMSRQIESLSRGVELLVATPGRLTDLIERGACSLGDVRTTVIDEADHMCDLGFLPAVRRLLDLVPADGQRLLFSATLDGDVDELVRRYLHDPVQHSVASATAPVEAVDHHLFVVDREDRHDVIARVAARRGRTIMFVRTKHGVDALTRKLARVGVRAGALHGGKTQAARTRTLADFREGRVGVLVATDVAARGIHVDDVSLVVHVDPAADHKDYLHRAGRTARAGERGTVATLVGQGEVRTTERMMRRAGVRAQRSRVSAGDDLLAQVTGAREPSGEPVPAEPRRGGPRAAGRGGRRPGARSPRRPARRTGDLPANARGAADARAGRSESDGPYGGGARAGSQSGRGFGETDRAGGDRGFGEGGDRGSGRTGGRYGGGRKGGRSGRGYGAGRAEGGRSGAARGRGRRGGRPGLRAEGR